MNYSAFLEMGGYGFYVWSAWGVGVSALFIMAQASLLKRRLLRQRIYIHIQRQNRRS